MPVSFGHTCGARQRSAAAAPLLLIGLLLLPLAMPTIWRADPVNAAAVPYPASASVSMGFSSSTLSPVSAGVPVYTVGDTMWVESAYNSSIPLSVTSARASPTSPPRLAAVTLLGPHVIDPVYTFTTKDADGTWNMTLGSQGGPIVIPVHFVNPASHPVSLAPLTYALQSGNLTISTQANLGDSYSQEICVAGNTTTGGVVVSPPAGASREGKLAIAPGKPLSVSALGPVNESFSFWIQLFYPYSLDEPAANSLVVNNLMTAQSPPVTFTATGTVNTTLSLDAPLREGRYDLRAYFQNSTSLGVVQTRVLVLNDSYWVSLKDTCHPSSVQSQNISYPSDLTVGRDAWPRNLFVMYRTFGVESVEAFPVRANLSSVDFLASPWNVPLSDIKLNISPSPGVAQTSEFGGSLFVLTSRYPTVVDFSVDVSGGHDAARGGVTLSQRYATQSYLLTLAKLTVRVLSDQGSPATLQITGPQGVNITRGLVPANATSSFILPGGSYTIVASQGGTSQSAQVSLTDGLSTSVTLDFSTFLTFEIILIATAIMAALANVTVWVLRSRSLGSMLAGK